MFLVFNLVMKGKFKMSKSKVKFENVKSFNTEILEPLYEILNNANSFAQNCVNPAVGIYFMQGIFRCIAYNHARRQKQNDKMSELLKLAANARNADEIKAYSADLKRMKYQAENSLDLKCFELVYKDAAEMYDNLITNYVEQSTNDNLILSFKTSDEILTDCYKSLEASEKTEIENNIEYLKQYLTL